jgi:DNA-binding GntR family transcriptional regulator
MHDEPQYIRAANDFRELLRTPEFPEGSEIIGGKLTIAERTGVTLGTAYNAMRELVRTGDLEVIAGNRPIVLADPYASSPAMIAEEIQHLGKALARAGETLLLALAKTNQPPTKG